MESICRRADNLKVHHGFIGPAIPNPVLCGWRLETTIIYLALLIGGLFSMASNTLRPLAHEPSGLISSFEPIGISSPTCCDAISILFPIIFIFERCIPRFRLFACIVSRRNTCDHPAHPKLVLQDGDLENPLENRTDFLCGTIFMIRVSIQL